MQIDSSVRIIGKVQIAENVKIGPFCLIGTEIDQKSEAITIIEESVQIESNVIIGQGSKIGRHCWIDHHCYIGCASSIAQRVEIMYAARINHRVMIGEGAWIGGFVCNDSIIKSEAIVMGNLVHRFTDASEDINETSPTVGTRAFIGMGATVIGGVHIGDGAYVAAGAVVTSDVPPHRLYTGTPACDTGRAPIPFTKWKNN